MRDLRQRWVAFFTCAVMVAIATMLFVAFSGASSNLEESALYTYERLKFLDFYLPLRSAPAQTVERIASLAGVEAAEGRRVLPLRVRLPGGDYLAGRAIGVPYNRQTQVNQLYLDGGRLLAARRGEVLMEKRFALAHGYQLNDLIEVESRDVRRQFNLVGLVSSPEYIWLATSRGDPRPAARRFGVLFVSQEDVSAMDGDDGINEIHVRVRDPLQRAAVMRAAQRSLEGYLSEAPVSREEQASNALLLRDRRAFAGVAALFPILFLGLSAIILLTTMMQLIAQQRRQIGVMMSQGFSSGQLTLHYLITSAVVGSFGAGVGGGAGWLLCEVCTRFYANSLGIPFLATRPPWAWMLVALGCATTVSVAAGWRAVSRLVKLDPAEVLRADFAPARRSPRRQAWFPALARVPYRLGLPLRNLLRQPARTVAVVLGIALAVVQMVLTLMMLDSQRSTLKFFFQSVHRYDVQVDLRLTSPASLPPIQSWPGVTRAEGLLWWNMRLSRGGQSMECGVWGVPPGSELLRLYDRDRHPLSLTDDSPLLLGPFQLRQLSALPGDFVGVRTASAVEHEPVLSYAVGPELFEPMALPPKLPLSKLQAQLVACEDISSDAINMMFLKVTPEAQQSVRRRLYTCPLVQSVIGLEETREDIRDLLKMLNAYLALMIGCSSLLAIAVLAGCSTMNIVERSRELATLSVLGVSDETLVGILLIEALLAWLLGLALGLPGGIWMGNWLLGHYQKDLIQLTLSISPSTIVGTALGSLVVCLIATAASLRSVLGIPLMVATQHAD